MRWRGITKKSILKKRNDLGTIVFLIGRQIDSKEDIEFLKTVLMEKPCLSLADCAKSDSPASGEAAHLEGINETTANYPQLMALRQMTEQYRMLRGTQTQTRRLPLKFSRRLKKRRVVQILRFSPMLNLLWIIFQVKINNRSL